MNAIQSWLSRRRDRRVAEEIKQKEVQAKKAKNLGERMKKNLEEMQPHGVQMVLGYFYDANFESIRCYCSFNGHLIEVAVGHSGGTNIKRIQDK